MGLKASATCELTFGQHGVPAVGWLVSDTHNGIAQMFQVIEYARMMVGTKAIATLSTGYLNALDSRDAVQGAIDPDDDKVAAGSSSTPMSGARCSTQKAYAEGLRALYLYTAAHQDAVVAAIVSGADAAMADRVNDLLLPIVKGVGSERAYQCLTESLQTSAARASCRTTRSSSTSATPRSTRSTRAPPRFRRRTSSSARSPRDQGEALRTCGQSSDVPRQPHGARRARRGRTLLATRCRRAGRWSPR